MACLACVLFVRSYPAIVERTRARRDLLRRRDSSSLANGTLLPTQLPLRILDPTVDAGSHRSKNAVDVPVLLGAWQLASADRQFGNDVLLTILRHGKRALNCKTKPRTRRRQVQEHKNDGRRRVRRVAGVTASKASSHPATFIREGLRIAASCTPDMPRWHWRR